MKKLLLVTLLSTGLPALAQAADYELHIKEHRFIPAELTLPANQRVKLLVINEDASPEEFEGEDFEAEKIVPGEGQILVTVGPFKPGRYEFVGEFHEDTAKGALIVE